jgi:hypothetical protein
MNGLDRVTALIVSFAIAVRRQVSWIFAGPIIAWTWDPPDWARSMLKQLGFDIWQISSGTWFTAMLICSTFILACRLIWLTMDRVWFGPLECVADEDGKPLVRIQTKNLGFFSNLVTTRMTICDPTGKAVSVRNNPLIMLTYARRNDKNRGDHSRRQYNLTRAPKFLEFLRYDAKNIELIHEDGIETLKLSPLHLKIETIGDGIHGKTIVLVRPCSNSIEISGDNNTIEIKKDG